MGRARTIFDKIWDSHVVTEREDGECLLYIDRLLLQENSFHAFDKIRRENRKVRNPAQAFAFGVSSSEVAHVLAVQGLWRRRPRTMLIEAADPLPAGTTAKDLIMAIIGKIGAAGAAGHVLDPDAFSFRDCRNTRCRQDLVQEHGSIAFKQ